MPEEQSTSISKGMIEKVRPARLQPFLRAERTLSTWARQNGDLPARSRFQPS